MATDGVMIDLRSDTVTRPTPGMRDAIAAAEVGDDTLGDDPTVRRLEERTAALLHKPAALFFPSGIMANQTALLCSTSPGSEVVVEAGAHVLDWEGGAAAHWSGVQLQVLDGTAYATPESVRRRLRPGSRYQPRTSLIWLENTHNAAGGRILPLDVMTDVRTLARERGIPIHLDGARLWNAGAATGHAPGEYAALADTVMVTLSKGLGCPVGSLLAGEADLIERAWIVRRRLGGTMRQAGILAAAGLYAYDHHLSRLAEDHRRALDLARLAAEVPGLGVVTPETNIVMIDVEAADLDAAQLVGRLAERGVLMSPFGPRRLRAVTHMDVDDDAIASAARALAEVLGR